MQYALLGRTGVRVSRVCLGTMMFGGPTAEIDAIAIIHQALDDGVNFIDTANMYNRGESERIVGLAIRDRRDRVVLATKGRHAMGDGPNDSGASRLHLLRELDHSLRRLQVDHVDLYYVHAPDDATPIDETLRALDDLVRCGKVRYIACSNFRAWRVSEALAVSDQVHQNRFVCVQPLYNIMNRDIEVELLPLCRQRQLGVVTYSPLARGILTGKYQPGAPPAEGTRAARRDARMMQAEWRDASLQAAAELARYCQARDVAPSQFAIAWCLANPLVTAVILGPRTRQQYEDNRCGAELNITADDETFVDQLVPPGEHTGKGFQDPLYPITGRPRVGG